MDGFDIPRFLAFGLSGHATAIGLQYHDCGADWAAFALPYDARLAADAATGVLATGPVVTTMDMATSFAVWRRRGRFALQVTLDLRLDYLRPAIPGRTVIGRGECYAIAGQIAHVRGAAHDGDPADPLAHVVGSFMLLDAA